MMDILLSLPILSFFLSSATTSWSTSLNLLFFYMTWSTLVLSHHPLHIQALGTLAIRLGLFLLPALLFLLFDTLLPSLAESIKHGGARALPPRNNPRQLARTLGLALFNTALQTALEAALALAHTRLTGGHPPFRATTALPLPFAAVKQLALLYAARELLTYHIHRRLLHPHHQHNTAAARHHAHAHARRAAPYALLLAADHPLPFLLHRCAPVYLPALALRPHLLVYFAFVALVTLEDTLAMSGYTVVPGFIMGGIARRNAAHYGGRGDGNFGAWGLLDWACGTGIGGAGGIESDVRLEAEKHAVKERGQRRASGAVEAVRDGVDGWRAKGRKKGRKGSGE